MFIENTDICNFADDNTLNKSSPNLSVVLSCLEHDILIVLNWFKVNSSKANPQKFQFMDLGGKVICFTKNEKISHSNASQSASFILYK